MAQIIFNEETREFSVTDMVTTYEDNKTKRLPVRSNVKIAKIDAKTQRQLNKLNYKTGKDAEISKRYKDRLDVVHRRIGAKNEMAEIISNHQLQKRKLKNANEESKRQHKTNIRQAKINALKNLG